MSIRSKDLTWAALAAFGLYVLGDVMVNGVWFLKQGKQFACKRCHIVLPDTSEYCGRRSGVMECGFCKSCMLAVCRG